MILKSASLLNKNPVLAGLAPANQNSKNGIGMRAVYVCLLLLLSHGITYCQPYSIKTYQQGLDSCKSILDAYQLIHPGKFLLAQPDCMLGAQMPEFTIMSMDSQVINLDYFKGKYTILNFWSSYCQPCIAEIPGLNAIVDKYGVDEYNYVAIGPDEAHVIKQLLKNHPWKFTQVPSAMSLMFDTLRMRWGYPTTFVLNKEAVIIAAFSGGKTDERAVPEIVEKLTAIIDKARK
jgi:thiol-disulfide isomerase/thioredoxin